MSRRARIRRLRGDSYEQLDLEHAQLRSFRNILLIAAASCSRRPVTLVFMASYPTLMPLCFPTGGPRTCPTQSMATARSNLQCTDILIVAMLGALGGAIAATLSIRNLKGTSTPYDVPIALAASQGAVGRSSPRSWLLVAIQGYVHSWAPSVLDSQGQILAYALVFGFAQQALSRLLDRQAQTLLEVLPGVHPHRIFFFFFSPPPPPPFFFIPAMRVAGPPTGLDGDLTDDDERHHAGEDRRGQLGTDEAEDDGHDDAGRDPQAGPTAARPRTTTATTWARRKYTAVAPHSSQRGPVSSGSWPCSTDGSQRHGDRRDGPGHDAVQRQPGAGRHRAAAQVRHAREAVQHRQPEHPRKQYERREPRQEQPRLGHRPGRRVHDLHHALAEHDDDEPPEPLREVPGVGDDWHRLQHLAHPVRSRPAGRGGCGVPLLAPRVPRSPPCRPPHGRPRMPGHAAVVRLAVAPRSGARPGPFASRALSCSIRLA